MTKECRWANHAAIGFAIAIVAIAGVAGWMYVVEPVLRGWYKRGTCGVLSGRPNLRRENVQATCVPYGVVRTGFVAERGLCRGGPTIFPSKINATGRDVRCGRGFVEPKHGREA